MLGKSDIAPAWYMGRAMTESRTFSLRPSVPGDDEFLYEMFVASRERELAPLPADMRDTLARQQYGIYRRGMSAAYSDARNLIVLGPARPAVPERVPIGALSLAERPDTLWLIDLVLHPDHRNRGWGTAILTSLMETCRRERRILKGSVAPYNPARRLYARLGLKEFGGERGYIALEWRPG